jgi:type I restriction enzyme S subunit
MTETIPEDWEEISLKKECDFERGVEPKSSEINNAGEGKPFLKVSSLSGKRNEAFFTTLETDKWVHKGEILLSLDGSLGIVRKDLEGIYSSGMRKTAFKDNKKYSNHYLYYGLQSSNIQKTIVKFCNDGGIIKHASNSINFMKLPIPSDIVEQEKIADILSKTDEQIKLTEEIIAKTEELKKGLMQELFTKGIGHTEFKDVKIGPREYSFGKEFTEAKFKDICSVRQGLQIAISKRFKEPGENRRLYITVQYIHKPDNFKWFVENPKQSVICEKNDILMTRTGNTGEIITDVEGVFHNNFFLIDYDRSKIDKYFLKYYLQSHLSQKIILAKAGTTTIPDLNHGDFYSITLAYPKLNEQKRIGNILFKIDANLNIFKEELAVSKNLKQGLMQDLLSGKVRVKV